jgi:hypothetical protein
MVEHPVRNFYCRLTVVARGSEVNAPQRFGHSSRRPATPKNSGKSGVTPIRRSLSTLKCFLSPKKLTSNPHCCVAHGRVARHVFPMRGRREERHPRRIRTCGRVAVGVGERDRGDWPPENVKVFFASQHAMAASAIANIGKRNLGHTGPLFPKAMLKTKPFVGFVW